MRSIADDLRAAAADTADSATTKRLTKAAGVLEGYSRAPGKRAEAVRVTRILTPEVLDVVAAGLLSIYREAPADSGPSFAGTKVVEARYAMCAVLLAAGSDDTELAERGVRAAEGLVPLVADVSAQEAEQLMFLAELLREDSPVAGSLATAAESRLRREPATPARRWAESLGLDLPFTRWEVALDVPGELTLSALIEDYPGSRSFYSARLTVTTRWTTILGDNYTRPGTVVDYQHRTNPEIAGQVQAPRELEDLPGLVDALLAASPGIALDRGAIKVRAYPRGLLTAAEKRRIASWMASAT